METSEEANKLINVSFNFAKSIFSNITLEIYKKLNFTNDSIYSSSKICGSTRLIDVILKVSNNNLDLVITDGTSNIGTDSIHMANIFKNVNAIEFSKINFDALQNNVK